MTDLQALREAIEEAILAFAEENDNVDSTELAKYLTKFVCINCGLVVKGSTEYMERREEARRQSYNPHPAAGGPALQMTKRRPQPEE